MQNELTLACCVKVSVPRIRYLISRLNGASHVWAARQTNREVGMSIAGERDMSHERPVLTELRRGKSTEERRRGLQSHQATRLPLDQRENPM